MANDWEINENAPDRGERYEWRLPANQQQHVEETIAPGDLLIKPADISLIPTSPPTQSGIQSGQLDWTIESNQDSNWYIIG